MVSLLFGLRVLRALRSDFDTGVAVQYSLNIKAPGKLISLEMHCLFSLLGANE